MRLSEAIRLGAMLKRKGRGPKSLYSTARGACALGAALNACSVPDTERIWESFPARWPILRTKVDMPVCRRHWVVMAQGPRLPLYEAIWIINDNSNWTREQIAGWVESIECEMESAPAADAVARSAGDSTD
jgi:hypothetical protein